MKLSIICETLSGNLTDIQKKRKLSYIKNHYFTGDGFIKEYGEELLTLKSKEIMELLKVYKYEQELKNIGSGNRINVGAFVDPELKILFLFLDCIVTFCLLFQIVQLEPVIALNYVLV